MQGTSSSESTEQVPNRFAAAIRFDDLIECRLAGCATLMSAIVERCCRSGLLLFLGLQCIDGLHDRFLGVGLAFADDYFGIVLQPIHIEFRVLA